MSDTVLEITTTVTEMVIGDGSGKTIVEVSTPVVELLTIGIQGPSGPPGPAGPTGAQGPPGPSGGGFNHTQSLAAAEWIINHNLGFRPAVEILGVGGNEVEAHVLHMSINQVRVYFTAAFAGSARCV